ncbi:HAD family hydrolase [Promicromonospora sp. NFX87]|uniref:HAD family hydrolase n=1 Tax=Promicromonospora sp. NFX87 TaxID=3402691 RepID=UPI003AFABB01
MTTTNDLRQSGAAMVVLDIDGTIAPSGTAEVTAAVRAAVARVRAAGHHVVLGSGRSLVGVVPIARLLGITAGWVVASNGAVTARLDPQAPDGYRLHQAITFDPGPVVRRTRSAFPGARVAAELVGRGYKVSHLFTPHELNGAQQIVDVAEVIDRHTTRLVLSAPGITVLRSKLQAVGVTVTPAGDNWLDVTPPGLSKATALEYVRTQLDVHPSRTTAVGDGINDLEMLAWANRGVAMGHAPAEVRAAADDVTGTLQDDGAATVLRSLLPETMPAGR